MSAPAQVGVAAVRPSRWDAVPHLPTREPTHELGSRLWQMAPALDQLAARYPEVSDQVIRQQAIEVLCVAEGHRVNAALVARLVEARVLALM